MATLERLFDTNLQSTNAEQSPSELNHSPEEIEAIQKQTVRAQSFQEAFEDPSRPNAPTPDYRQTAFEDPGETVTVTLRESEHPLKEQKGIDTLGVISVVEKNHETGKTNVTFGWVDAHGKLIDNDGNEIQDTRTLDDAIERMRTDISGIEDPLNLIDDDTIHIYEEADPRYKWDIIDQNPNYSWPQET